MDEEYNEQESEENEGDAEEAFDNDEGADEQSDFEGSTDEESEENESNDGGSDIGTKFFSWVKENWRNCITYLFICFVAGAVIGIVKNWNSIVALVQHKDGTIDKTHRGGNQTPEKKAISYFDDAAAGSGAAREHLINIAMKEMIKNRGYATDDGTTDKLLVKMAAEGWIDDQIKAYKKIRREFGSDKYISWDDLQVPDPPLAVSLRTGLLSDLVIQVRNESDKTQHVRVFIYNGNRYDSIIGKAIKPRETVDFGYLEFENSWKPTLGDKGFVFVNGYNKLLTFFLPENINRPYQTGTAFIVPPDCPLGLKKEFLRLNGE